MQIKPTREKGNSSWRTTKLPVVNTSSSQFLSLSPAYQRFSTLMIFWVLKRHPLLSLWIWNKKTDYCRDHPLWTPKWYLKNNDVLNHTHYQHSAGKNNALLQERQTDFKLEHKAERQSVWKNTEGENKADGVVIFCFHTPGFVYTTSGLKWWEIWPWLLL